MHMRLIGASLLVTMGLLAGAAHAQDAATPMQLNRAGRWPEAAALAERLLAAPGDTPLVERCEHRYSLGYASVFLEAPVSFAG